MAEPATGVQVLKSPCSFVKSGFAAGVRLHLVHGRQPVGEGGLGDEVGCWGEDVPKTASGLVAVNAPVVALGVLKWPI